jgi:ethanolamine permease
MIWGLGVGYVISGSYFGWNLGLEQGGPWGMLLATLVATLLYVSFVLGYAELSCAIPRAGGAFVYAQRAFGEKTAFVVGFAQLVEYCLAPPAIAFAIGSYIDTGWGDRIRALVGLAPAQDGDLVTVVTLVAVLAYVIFTLINMRGAKLSASIELVITVVAVVELLIFGCVALPGFKWETFSQDALPNGWGGAFLALPFALWFYLAIEGVANIAEEAKDPQRDLSRGFLSAMGTLVVLAMIVFFGAVGVAGWKAVYFVNGVDGVSSDSPLPLAIKHLHGEGWLFLVMTNFGLLGLIASFHGIILASSRALLEMGRSSFLPKAIGRLHETRGTPVIALAVNFVVGMLALLTGKTGDIIILAIFGALTLYFFSTIALFRMRKLEPDLPRPYKTPGYPVVPVVSLVLTVVALASMVWTKPYLAGIYVAIMAISFVIWIALRKSDAATEKASPP